MKQITADTEVCTWTADFAGYTLVDNVIGSGCTYDDACAGCNSADDLTAEVTTWISYMIRTPTGDDVFFLNELEAVTAAADSGSSFPAMTLEWTTPRRAAEQIWALYQAQH